MRPAGWRALLLLGPAVFLLVFFAVPNAFLLSASLLKSEAQQLTAEPTLENFRELLGSRLYVGAILRSFGIGAAVGLLVVLLSYPLAYFLTRTTSRWQGVLIALSLSPLIASVVVRTYGWYVIMSREGLVNNLLLGLGLVAEPQRLLPSTTAITIGLAHALMPYGVLTIMSSLKGLNPNLERAAMGLGAGRFTTFVTITLPLTLPGVVGGFLLAFSIALSAYATPAILGGPATETMATLIRNFMVVLLDWSLGSAMGAILVVSALAVLVLTSVLGAKREAA